MEISKVIKRHGYTIQQVAEQMPNKNKENKKGVTRESLVKTIGSKGNPTVSTLRAIANIIGGQVIEFFEDEVSGPSDQKPKRTKSSAKLVCPHCGKTITIHAD